VTPAEEKFCEILRRLAEGRKQEFMQGIKGKVVVISGEGSESIRPPRRSGRAGSGIGEAT